MSLLILVLTLLFSVADRNSIAGGDFDRMKALAGEWEATTPEGKTQITFRVISGGSAVMESMTNGNMVTIYHPDGESVLMTHYCEAGNQPRMRAQKAAADGSIAFQFVDVANVKSTGEGRMHRLVIRILDRDHVTEDWTWKEGNNETTSRFELKRVK